MPEADCGFHDIFGGAAGSDLLQHHGPTILVDIGFDPTFQTTTSPGPTPSAINILPVPLAGMTGIRALVDTGAAESCLDSVLAAQLNLPIVDRRAVSGAHGSQEVNLHLAQVYLPSLNRIIYGVFAGVHLAAGGQSHGALIGRTFLRNYTLIYEGRTGRARLSSV